MRGQEAPADAVTTIQPPPSVRMPEAADAVTTNPPSSDYVATFAAGPFGLGLANTTDGQVVVTSVEAGLAAEAQGVVMGSAVHEVNGKSTQGLDKAGVIKLIMATTRPLTIKFSHPENMYHI